MGRLAALLAAACLCAAALVAADGTDSSISREKRWPVLDDCIILCRTCDQRAANPEACQSCFEDEWCPHHGNATEERLRATEAKLKGAEQKLAALMNRVAILEKKQSKGRESRSGLTTLRKHIGNIQTRYDQSFSTLSNDIWQTKMAVSKIKQARDRRGIFFSVQNRVSQEVKAGGTVVFSTSLDNPNAAYLTRTGEFTCRVPGVYVFTLTATSQGGSTDFVWLGIYKGDSVKAVTRCRSFYDQSSNTVTLRLQKGDVIKVKDVHNSGTSKVYGSIMPFTTFTGRLVAV